MVWGEGRTVRTGKGSQVVFRSNKCGGGGWGGGGGQGQRGKSR